MPLNTVKCNSCNVVINELLAFLQHVLDVMDEDSVHQLCTSSFSAEEIVKAKTLLYESIPSGKKMPVRRKDGKKKMSRDLDDMISLLKGSNPELFPIFVAKELHKLPPVSFDHVDVTRLLKDLVKLQNKDRCPMGPTGSRVATTHRKTSVGRSPTRWTVDLQHVGPCHMYSNGLGLGRQEEIDWRDVITEAEQIVGYPTSFLNLRWLFNDEIASSAIHLRKLVGSNHPVLKSAKNLLVGSKSNLQSVGLIILLASKAAGFDPLEFSRDHYDSGVLHSQRGLAEIVEMKRTGHMIHKAMVNLQHKKGHGDKYKDLLYGNKIVLLTGDFLLATCLQHLGGLRNNEVTELISTGLRDLVEGDAFGLHDDGHNPLPSKPKGDDSQPVTYDWENEDNLKKLGSEYYLGRGIAEWKLRTMLMSGSILGKGCQGAMKLAHRGPEMEKNAYILGGHLALLWQLYLDVKDFFTHPYSFSLVGAPITIALWEYPQIYGHIWESKVEKSPLEYQQLYYAVRSTRSMDYFMKVLDDELAAVLEYSNRFPVEDARTALQKMALTIHGEALQYIEK